MTLELITDSDTIIDSRLSCIGLSAISSIMILKASSIPLLHVISALTKDSFFSLYSTFPKSKSSAILILQCGKLIDSVNKGMFCITNVKSSHVISKLNSLAS